MGTSRSKTAHQIGTIATAVWVPVGDHSYTGMFAEGAEYGFMRLSDSGFIIESAAEKDCNPSMALKWLVDDEASVDLVFAIDWNNTPGWDFFPLDDAGSQAKPFTNHPNPIDSTDTCERVTQASKLHEATGNAFSCGTGHMAEVT
jgi:hypothetical protein